jgi:hypothetical protein
LLQTENPEAAFKLGAAIFDNDDLENKKNRATFGQQ